MLIAFWPDRTPEPTEKCALYQYSWFDMRLDTSACSQWAASIQAANHPASADSAQSNIDTADGKARDTQLVTLVEKSAPSDTAGASHHPSAERGTKAPKHIHLNTILLIMVATGGFLGNMIHIATSFTTYIGAGSFRKSWILWYWVRPFTASALALALYFAFGASNNPGNVDIDRTLTIAVLAGLFTDIATQKLKEVFDVIFNPKQNRPDPLATTGFLITDDDTEPDILVKDAD
ncbi:MAG TPA: hypothetical protein VM187_01015, partial [Niastella sp.]|nr:hypothetical protein [Niastella sp.]